jgi:DNA-directed RNA polymerase specialized sigma24 family protein
MIGRPKLQEIFQGSTRRKERNRRIVTAHETHEYTLKEIGTHLELHYSTVSRLKAREKRKTAKGKTPYTKGYSIGMMRNFQRSPSARTERIS